VTKDENRHLQDLSAREIIAVAPVLVAIVWIGVYPKPFLERIEPSVQVLLGRLRAAGATHHLVEAPAPSLESMLSAVAPRETRPD
jgi:NADH:ubiquinone oxidoreductase subunit 4 (subunit M)